MITMALGIIIIMLTPLWCIIAMILNAIWDNEPSERARRYTSSAYKQQQKADRLRREFIEKYGKTPY